jgi:hypothetical protein
MCPHAEQILLQFPAIQSVQQADSKPLLAHIYELVLYVRLKSSLAVAVQMCTYYSTGIMSEISLENTPL